MSAFGVTLEMSGYAWLGVTSRDIVWRSVISKWIVPSTHYLGSTTKTSPIFWRSCIFFSHICDCNLSQSVSQKPRPPHPRSSIIGLFSHRPAHFPIHLSLFYSSIVPPPISLFIYYWSILPSPRPYLHLFVIVLLSSAPPTKRGF